MRPSHALPSIPAAPAEIDISSPNGAAVGADAATLAYSVRARLANLYGYTAGATHLFASPLGPYFHRGHSGYVPRFVFFGPNTSEASWRVAFLAGLDHRDTRASDALLAVIEDLGRNVEDAHALDLTFFPVVNSAGFFLGAAPRPLGSLHWGRGEAPELDLLEKDARLRAYHGFVRVESTSAESEVLTIRVHAPGDSAHVAPDVELISSDETDPFPVRFENGRSTAGGPLSIADDLPFGPFELTLRVPAAWSDDIYQEAVRSILHRFIRRYRAFQAYGQHL